MITVVTSRRAGIGAPTEIAEAAAVPTGAMTVVDSARLSTGEAEATLLRLKERVSIEAQRETLASNIDAIHHRIAMNVIANLKA